MFLEFPGEAQERLEISQREQCVIDPDVAMVERRSEMSADEIGLEQALIASSTTAVAHALG